MNTVGYGKSFLFNVVFDNLFEIVKYEILQ